MNQGKEEILDNVKSVKKRKGFRWSLIKLFIIFLILVNMTAIALNSPIIQKKIALSIGEYISNKTGYQVTLTRVELNINKGVQLNDFIIKDLNDSILLDAGSFSTDLVDNLISMAMFNEYDLSDVKIENAKLNIVKNKGDEKSNLQDFISKLSSKKKKKGNCTVLDIDNIDLLNVFISNRLFDKPNDELVYIGSAKIVFNKIDLCAKEISLKKLVLLKPKVEVIRKNARALQKTSNSKNKKLINIDLAFDIDKLDIKDGEFIYRKQNIPHPYNNVYPHIDFSDVEVTDLNVLVHGIKYDSLSKLSFVAEEISLKEKHGLNLKKLIVNNGYIDDTQIGLNGLSLKTNNSNVDCDLLFSFKEKADFKDFENKVYIKANLNKSQIKFKDILQFTSKAKESSILVKNMDRTIYFNGNVKGYINNLVSKKFKINIENKFVLKTAFVLKDIAVKRKEYIELTNTAFSSSSDYIKSLFEKKDFGKGFSKLGNIEYQGEFVGLLKDFKTFGELNSDLGSSKFNLSMQFGEKKEDARYSGDISFNNFDLGSFIGNEKVGKLTVDARIDEGRSLNLKNANAKITAKIDSFDYNGYKYKEVGINAFVKSKRFNGNLSINDKNINIDLDGIIDMEDSIPIYNFTTDIKRIDLYALHLYKRPLVIRGIANMDFLGADIEGFSGKMLLKDVLLSNRSKSVNIDSLNLSSVISDNNERYVDIDSDIFTFYFDGKYKLKNIPDAVYRIFNRNFSKFIVGLNKDEVKDESFNEYYYDFNLDIPDSKDILEILTGKQIQFNRLSLDGSANHKQDSLMIKFNIDSLHYENSYVVGFKSDFNLYQGYGDFTLNSDFATYKNTKISRIGFDTDVSQDELFFQLSVDSIGKKISNIALSGRSIPFKDSFGIEIYGGHIKAIEDNLEFSGQNKITVGKNYINLVDFVISEDESKIRIEDTNNNKGIVAKLEDFDIGVVNVLLKYNKLNFTGKTNGFVEVNNIFKTKYIESNIQIPDLKVNDKYYGALETRLKLDTIKKDKLVFDFSLKDITSSIRADGFYDIKDKVFYGDFNVDDFPLEFLENIITDGISNTQGQLTAHMRVFGPFKKVSITGGGIVNDGQTTVDYIGVPYFFDKQKFIINNNGIDMTGVEISDEFGNIGYAHGGITFDRFRDFGVDVNLKSDRILALNTTEKMNPDYWGKALGKVDATFKGIFKKVISMKIDAETGAETKLTIPIKLYVEVSDKSFINFNRSLKKESKKKVASRIKGIDVDMKIKITELADMKIIMDPNAGDNLVGKGEGVVRLLVSQDQEIEMYGDFKFTKGKYLFTLYDVVNKEFTIRPQSTITWFGDPFEGIMDIKADYNANRISLTNIISEYLTTTEKRNYKGDVALTSMLTGPLLHPKIDFDFNISNVDNSINNYVVSKLQKLKSSPNAIYTQVVGLMVWGTFLPDENLVGNLGNSSFLASGGINTISEFITTKLSGYITSLLAEAIVDSDIISGVDVSLNSKNSSSVIPNSDQESKLPQYHSLNTTLWLLEDKIKVQFGTDYTGKADFKTRNNFISGGNVNLELFLTDSKRLRLRLFFKREFDEINTDWENKSGLGLRYSDEFGDIYKKRKVK